MGHEKDVPCVFCGGDVAGTVWHLCAACHVPAHTSCWDERGACPVLECGSTKTLDPAAAIFRKKPGEGPATPDALSAQPAASTLPALTEARRELDALEVADALRHERQARSFAIALAGWAASLVLAAKFPVFYVLGAGWFLTWMSGAVVLEVQGWLSGRRRKSRELPP